MKTVTIERTTDYDKFKFMGGNRAVSVSHVKHLENEMQYNPEMFEAQPILVNENFYIVDGQHRFYAAMNLGLPIYFIVKKGLSIEAARHLNTTQKGWTILDFAKSYADSGRKDYIDFLRVHAKFPRINVSLTILCLQGRSVHRGDSDFRRGEFKVNDMDAAIDYLEKIDEVQRITGQKMNTPMGVSIMRLVRDNEDFDWNHFIDKLSKDSARNSFIMGVNVRSCLRSIEDVYNFQSRFRTRLY
jgi:hypothetical protein